MDFIGLWLQWIEFQLAWIGLYYLSALRWHLLRYINKTELNWIELNGCQWLESQIFLIIISFLLVLSFFTSFTTSGSGWVDIREGFIVLFCFTCLWTFLSFYPFILLFCYSFSCYVKHIELHLCMKCAIQIKLLCLA